MKRKNIGLVWITRANPEDKAISQKTLGKAEAAQFGQPSNASSFKRIAQGESNWLYPSVYFVREPIFDYTLDQQNQRNN